MKSGYRLGRKTKNGSIVLSSLSPIGTPSTNVLLNLQLQKCKWVSFSLIFSIHWNALMVVQERESFDPSINDVFPRSVVDMSRCLVAAFDTMCQLHNVSKLL